MAIVIGNEGEGISRLVSENCDFLVSIPMFGETESLNASVRGGGSALRGGAPEKELIYTIPRICRVYIYNFLLWKLHIKKAIIKFVNSLTHKKEKAVDRLISVILPTYNNGDMISECIDSVLCQTYENFELIIVNDGSTDDSESVPGKYSKRDGRVRVINKENGGVSSARNRGLFDLLTGTHYPKGN